ncbi:SDR family NAD(P)-dependent oxidoreductase [Streptomyces albofaciens]|uniref:type I polyketide synthase n=1 Tax=Streptomyces albofaciens TaxID=66866 RepID=UPI00142EE43E|nr:type I polyketide synthase [Streptomyces albofaciens]
MTAARSEVADGGGGPVTPPGGGAAASSGREPQAVPDPAPGPGPAPGPDPDWRESDVAVVGIACRFPGATGPDEFWNMIAEGRRGIGELTPEQLAEAGAGPARLADPALVPAAGILWDADRFDSAFFGYSARETAVMDPQQRMFLEAAWHALDDTGHDPERFPGRVGVYAGQTVGTHRTPDSSVFLGTSADLLMAADDKDFLPTRAAYKLGLTGPAFAVQAACSTSLVAVHVACRALAAGDCDLALAGGVSWSPWRRQGYLRRAGGVWSADGCVRCFDRDATGFVSGDGLGIVALRRLADARADGDRLYAVIKGSAVNNDGNDKLSYAAPGIPGQQAVIEAALRDAAVDPDTVGYVEAHGTATALGDAIEVTALNRAYRAAGATGRGTCRLGSVKANIGHADAAAGVAGFIKAALMVRHGRIPPTPNTPFHPHPDIDFAAGPFVPAVAAEDWPRTSAPRRAAVSAFGVGGTNAHVILQEPPPARPPAPARPWQLLAWSARDERALDAMAAAHPRTLRGLRDEEFADYARTLAVGRRRMPLRRAVVLRDRAHALTESAFRTDAAPPREGRAGEVAFVFPGGGSQYPGMGRGLYRDEPVFRETVDTCLRLLPDREAARRLRAWWPTGTGTEPAADTPPDADADPDPRVAMPAVFITEIAVARLLGSFGVTPSVLTGHSLGEYAAAHLAGVLSLPDALTLVSSRGRLLSAVDNGAMLVVRADARGLGPFLGDGVCLAVVNGPDACVLSGPAPRIGTARRRLAAEGIACNVLQLATAAHSALVDPVLGAFRDVVRGIALGRPAVPLISNLTGTADADYADPEYWVRHLRETVRFDLGLACLRGHDPRVLLEAGPGTTLTTLARTQGLDRGVPAMRHPLEERDDREVLLTALARTWEAGIDVDLAALWPASGPRVPAAPYPFAPTRHRPAPAGAPAPEQAAGPWYGVAWQRDLEPEPARTGTEVTGYRWLLLHDGSPVADALRHELAERGAASTTVLPDTGAARRGHGRDGERAVTLDPCAPDQYAKVIETAGGDPDLPLRIVSTWNGAPSHAACPPLSDLAGLARALATPAGGTELCLVTRGALEITGSESLDPWAALTVGAAGALGAELGDAATVRVVDIDGPGAAADGGQVRELARDLLREFTRPGASGPVGLRAGRRWLRRFEPLRTPPVADGTALREGGRYLITGGTGGIGRLLAGHLLRDHHARVTLLGRDPDAVRATAGELSGLPGELLAVSGDITDPARTREVLRETLRRFGGLDGVVHAAGVPAGGLAQLLTPDSVAEALAAKTTGTVTLADALRETGARPDFVLLFSSLAAFSQAPGLSCYGAANAFLDTYAHAAARTEGPAVLAVNWDRWNGVGMGREGERRQRALGGGAPLGGLEPADALAAFERCLGALSLGQVVVSVLPPDTVAGPPGKDDGAEPQSDAGDRPDEAPETSPSGTDTTTWSPLEREVLRIWQDVLGNAEGIGLHDDFFGLGGHSLAALQIVQRCQDSFGVDLSVKSVFLAPTVARLAAELSAARGAAVPGPEEPAPGPEESAPGREAPASERKDPV